MNRPLRFFSGFQFQKKQLIFLILTSEKLFIDSLFSILLTISFKFTFFPFLSSFSEILDIQRGCFLLHLQSHSSTETVTKKYLKITLFFFAFVQPYVGLAIFPLGAVEFPNCLPRASNESANIIFLKSRKTAKIHKSRFPFSRRFQPIYSNFIVSKRDRTSLAFRLEIITLY